MHQIIKTLYEQKGKSRKLFIMGHSLGGALATVATARLAYVDNMHITALYTIGSPKVLYSRWQIRRKSRSNGYIGRAVVTSVGKTAVTAVGFGIVVRMVHRCIAHLYHLMSD